MEQVTKKASTKKPTQKVVVPSDSGVTPEELSTSPVIPFKAVGMYRDKDGWRTIELTIEDNQVVKSTTSEFMNRAICFEDLKIKVVKNFLKGE
jgi:hypothetical protein